MKLLRIYHCLCDLTRLRILYLLGQGPLCVCHLQSALLLPQVKVSKHLASLRKTGMVEARRNGQWMLYSLPKRRSGLVNRHLKCLQDCVQEEPVFRKDLIRLHNLHQECGSPSSKLLSVKHK